MSEVVDCENGPSSTINKILGREANSYSKCISSRKCCDSSGGELGIDQGAFSRQEFNSGLSHQDANGGVPLQKVNRDFNQDGKAPASFTA
jgi:hypothetical protein